MNKKTLTMTAKPKKTLTLTKKPKKTLTLTKKKPVTVPKGTNIKRVAYK